MTYSWKHIDPKTGHAVCSFGHDHPDGAIEDCEAALTELKALGRGILSEVGFEVDGPTARIKDGEIVMDQESEGE